MPGNWAGSTRRQRLPANWSTEIVPRIKARDSYRCTWIDNGQRCTGPADEVDHRDRHAGDTDTNLRSLCRYHHARKTTQEGNEARWRYTNRRPPEQHPGLR